MSAAPVETPAPTTPATPATPPNVTAVPDVVAPGLKFAPPVSTPGNVPAPPPPATVAIHPWMGELDADQTAYAQGKGWLKEGKTFADVVKAHRSAEGLLGRPADQLMPKPDWSKPESVAEYRAAVGAPAAPDGYSTEGLEIPSELVDEGLVRTLAHDFGFTQPQFETAMKKVAEAQTTLISGHMQDVERRGAAELVEWEKEQGTALAESKQAVQNAITANGITEDVFKALEVGMGAKGVREFFKGLDARYGEHKTPSTTEPTFQITTPEVARAQIKTLYSDKAFMADLEAGGTREADAKRKWAELHSIANSGG